MISVETGVQVQSVNVMTSDEGGLSADQVTELAMDKILFVSNTAPPVIRDQAEAFEQGIRAVVSHYIQLAMSQERATIARRMEKAGNSEMADLVRRI